MQMTKLAGWLFGIDGVSSIDDIDFALAAPWVQDNIFWLCLASASFVVLAVIFYRRFQLRGTIRTRTILGIVRGVLLTLLLLTLAAPVLRITLTSIRPPTLFLVFDGTDSMDIEDQWTDEQRKALLTAVGIPESTPAEELPRSRADFVQALLQRNTDNIFNQLQQANGARIEAFVFDGHATSHLRRLPNDASAKDLPRRRWSEQITTTGQVSALGAVLNDLRDQAGTTNLAGVILFSDFAHNSGPSPVGEETQSASRSAGIPIHTVGLGAIETIDAAIELQTDLKMKKAERSSIVAKVRQTGLNDRSAQVKLTARRLSSSDSTSPSVDILIGEKQLTLSSAVEATEFSFTPQESGLFEFTATVEPLNGESVHENNVAKRQVNIIDDYLRLMFVAYEPDWEWRFVKEVFHRDKLVGMDGFRTFLGSSDPRVRESNVLFLETLTPKRADFFRQDVVFLGDMPNSAITTRFAEMVKEFVSNLGGGLVVISGPRFGPRELQGTPLADLLPVVVDPNARLRDERPFRPRRTAHAASYPFMRLGESDAENEKAWNNLDEVPWYQPVAALNDQAIVLAEHPTDKLADQKTPQPLIAARQFGRGEVVYIGFNEMWRLRRKYGEQYYRQFWSQMIYRLGMSHALGAAKRFVPRVDRQVYRVEDKVTLTVEAYDEDYEPLTGEDVPEGGLKAELITPDREGSGPQVTSIAVPLLRNGVCETRFPVYAAGEYSIRVTDPVTGQVEERRFEVTDSSAERRRPVRDLRLQEEIARQSGGNSYDLLTVANLPKDVKAEPFVERNTRSHPLWSTPLWFMLIAGFMLGEWITRKLLFMS
jgi:hypothetical protein